MAALIADDAIIEIVSRYAKPKGRRSVTTALLSVASSSIGNVI
jgi:hypothetical protein